MKCALIIDCVRGCVCACVGGWVGGWERERERERDRERERERSIKGEHDSSSHSKDKGNSASEEYK